MQIFRHKGKTHIEPFESIDEVTTNVSHLGSSISFSDSSIKENAGYTVVKKHKSRTLFRYWIHLLAIVTTGGLAALNFLNVYLMDSDDPDAIAKLGAFQFVAKLHEGIILGSMSLAMIDYVRRRLLSPAGIPLGFLLSPTMYNNIDWLLSASFWTNRPAGREIIRNTFRPSFSLPPFLVVTLAIVIANVAGPMSAITVVPRLGWSNSEVVGLFPTFWNASAASFRPMELNTALLPTKCAEGGAMGTAGCPAWGSKSVSVRLSPRLGPGVFCTAEGFQSSCNASMSSSSAASAIVRSLSVDFDRSTLTTFASTPNAAIYETLGFRFQSGIAFRSKVPDTASIEAGKVALVEADFADSAGMFKPAVATSCRELAYDQIVDIYQSRNISTNWTAPTVTWLNDATGLETDAFLFSYMVNSTQLDVQSACQDKDCYAAVVCGIEARWSSHGLWYSTAQTTSLFQSNPQPRGIFNPTKAADLPVIIRKGWLELTSVDGDTELSANIVSLLNDWNVPRVGTALDIQGKQQTNFGPTNHSSAISVILAATVTESMANGPPAIGDSLYNGNCSDTRPGFRFSPAICDEDPSIWIRAKELPQPVSQDYTMINFSVRRAGWGWFWQDSLALQISLGALLLHGLLTACYVVYTLIFTRTITTRWASATELLILAIDSFRAPTLANSSIRARDSKIWLEPVTIREVEYGDRVSLIVGDGGSYPERVGGPPELGKKYL